MHRIFCKGKFAHIVERNKPCIAIKIWPRRDLEAVSLITWTPIAGLPDLTTYVTLPPVPSDAVAFPIDAFFLEDNLAAREQLFLQCPASTVPFTAHEKYRLLFQDFSIGFLTSS
jgi:hypothetical protein